MFLRKNITLEQLFNYAFLAGLIGLLLARLVSTLSSGKGSPAITFFSPYVSGLSLTGGIVGGFAFLLFLCRRQKLPSGRLLDVFSLAVVTVLPIGYIGVIFLSPKIILIQTAFAVLFLLLAIFFNLFLYTRSLRGELREGSVTGLFFLAYGIQGILGILLARPGNLVSAVTLDNILLVLLLIGSVIFLVFNERRTFSRKRR